MQRQALEKQNGRKSLFHRGAGENWYSRVDFRVHMHLVPIRCQSSHFFIYYGNGSPESYIFTLPSSLETILIFLLVLLWAFYWNETKFKGTGPMFPGENPHAVNMPRHFVLRLCSRRLSSPFLFSHPRTHYFAPCAICAGVKFGRAWPISCSSRHAAALGLNYGGP